ncbi:hypothetical protein ABH925_006197 [Streptacidiphilus sp. EB129]
MHHGTTPTIRSEPPTGGAKKKSRVETCHTRTSAHTSTGVRTFIHNTAALRCCAPSDLRPLSTGDLMHGRQMSTTYEVSCPAFKTSPKGMVA